MLTDLGPNFNLVEHLYTAFALAAQLYFFTRWTLARIEHYKETERFIYALKNNHLKHIYRNLKALCDKAGIEFSEPESEDE